MKHRLAIAILLAGTLALVLAWAGGLRAEPEPAEPTEVFDEAAANADMLWRMEEVAQGGYGALSLAIYDGPIARPRIAATSLANYLTYHQLTASGWISEPVVAAEHAVLAISDSDVPHVGYQLPGPTVLYATKSSGLWVTTPINEVKANMPTIALDSAGRPRMGYQDPRTTAGTLGRGTLYAEWTGTEWIEQEVDGSVAGCTGYCDPVSIALDTADAPRLAYFDLNGLTIKYAARSGSSTWAAEAATTYGRYPDLAIGSDNIPQIAYVQGTLEVPSGIGYAVRAGSEWIVETAASGNVTAPAIAVDVNNRPHLAYCPNVLVATGLRYAFRADSGWQIQVLDDVACSTPSLALDDIGNAHITYFDAAGRIRYIRWAGPYGIEITDAGGTLSSPDDGTVVTVPTGTFTETVVLYHTPVMPWTLPEAPALISIGHGFDLTAIISSTGAVAQPVQGATYEVQVPYLDSELGTVGESTLALYGWDGTSWHREPTSQVDTASNVVSAQPSTFSLWAVLGQTHRVSLPLIIRQ